MRLYIFSILLMFMGMQLLFSQPTSADKRLQPYIDVIKQDGMNPVAFVIDKLQQHDLIIFDDALHTAVEPFEFYQELIKTPTFYTNVQYIFIEAVSINQQPHIDAYFTANTENVELLYPAFQEDFSGLGWTYKTYFDLLHTIFLLNKTLPEEQQLKVIAVSNPTYWSEINTAKDVELFQKTLRSHDFLMYKTIADQMNNFNSGKKGIFLTNSRHAYKEIKNIKNELYWNCGTFFYQWHPGKTYSIRFNNVNLFLEKEKTVKIKWDRIANGIWDSAFKAVGDKPVAIPLKNNVFGSEPYIGNHMLNVYPNQTIFNAYDGLIFLGPLEAMYKTAKVDIIYTNKFKKELERRYKILFTPDEINQQMENYNTKNVSDLIEQQHAAEAQKSLPQAKAIEPINTWMHKNNQQ
jgi:hypothetical protein